MIKLITIFIVALSLPPMFGKCDKKKPPPPKDPPPAASPLPTVEPTPEVTPSVQPTPVVEPSPVASPTAPIVRATPHPTPDINPESWFKPWNTGQTITVRAKEGEDLGALVNAADKELKNGIILIEGGGSIKTQITLHNDSKWDSSTYSCDTLDITDYGCILLADSTRHEGTWRIHPVLIDYFKHGKGWDWRDPYLLKVQALTDEELAGTGTTFLEPTFVADWAPLPHITVFQALGDACCAHTYKAEGISVRGFHVRGRQKVYDGGVRSTILLGNCHNCTVQDTYLEDTASIGITAGGSGLEWRRDVEGGVEEWRDNHARNVLFWHNVARGVAAANIASINGEQIYIGENYARAPGHKDEIVNGKVSSFGGGVCHVDFESNSPADHTGGIVWNNLSDYEGAAKSGNAICLQDPYFGVNHKPIYAFNNMTIGGRNDNIWRYMTSGFFLNGLTGCHVSNNYVYRTGQNGMQIHSIKKCVIEDNDFESTGGGGNPTIWSNDSFDNVFRRNNYRDRPGLSINTQAGFIEICGGRNVYENNLTAGQDTQPSRRCP